MQGEHRGDVLGGGTEAEGPLQPVGGDAGHAGELPGAGVDRGFGAQPVSTAAMNEIDSRWPWRHTSSSMARSTGVANSRTWRSGSSGLV